MPRAGVVTNSFDASISGDLIGMFSRKIFKARRFLQHKNEQEVLKKNAKQLLNTRVVWDLV